ncbi:hypothetical protein Tco_0360785 [Tanacetum coccineum]
MIMEGSELTKDDRESLFTMNLYTYVNSKEKRNQFKDTTFSLRSSINDMRNIKMTMSRMQLNSKFREQHVAGSVVNAKGTKAMVQDRESCGSSCPVEITMKIIQGDISREEHAREMVAHSTRMSKAKATSRFRLLQGQDATNASPGECGSTDEEQLLFIAGEQVTNVDDNVDDSPETDLALNVDHVFEADECDAFDSDV